MKRTLTIQIDTSYGTEDNPEECGCCPHRSNGGKGEWGCELFFAVLWSQKSRTLRCNKCIQAEIDVPREKVNG